MLHSPEILWLRVFCALAIRERATVNKLRICNFWEYRRNYYTYVLVNLGCLKTCLTMQWFNSGGKSFWWKSGGILLFDNKEGTTETNKNRFLNELFNCYKILSIIYLILACCNPESVISALIKNLSEAWKKIFESVKP